MLNFGIAAIVSALAILVKPGACLFQILGAFISLAIDRNGIRRTIVDPKLFIFVGIILSPSIIYLFYGIFLAEGLQTGGRFLPHLILETFFWRGWFRQIRVVFGFTALIGALLGVLMYRKGQSRTLLVGLWIGYIIFSFS
jgi:hypothetical protein